MDFDVINAEANPELLEFYMDCLQFELQGVQSLYEFRKVLSEKTAQSDLREWHTHTLIFEDNTDGDDGRPEMILHDMFNDEPSIGFDQDRFFEIIRTVIFRNPNNPSSKTLH